MSAPSTSRSPRLSAVLREGERVTPLELFFDLVFVLAIAILMQGSKYNVRYGKEASDPVCGQEHG